MLCLSKHIFVTCRSHIALPAAPLALIHCASGACVLCIKGIKCMPGLLVPCRPAPRESEKGEVGEHCQVGFAGRSLCLEQYWHGCLVNCIAL